MRGPLLAGHFPKPIKYSESLHRFTQPDLILSLVLRDCFKMCYKSSVRLSPAILSDTHPIQTALHLLLQWRFSS